MVRREQSNVQMIWESFPLEEKENKRAMEAQQREGKY